MEARDNIYGLLLLLLMKLHRTLLMSALVLISATTSSSPSFKGYDDFCVTRIIIYNYIIECDNPLWDGKGCGGNNMCCSFKMLLLKYISNRIALATSVISRTVSLDTHTQVMHTYAHTIMYA